MLIFNLPNLMSLLQKIHIKLMKKIILFLVILLVVCSRRPQGQCPLADYDYNLLSLSWPAEFCTSTSCLFDWQELWKGNVATIHGFWPSWSQSYPKSCEARWRRGDRACMNKAYMMDLDIDVVFKDDPQLLADIKTRWPSLKYKVIDREQVDPKWFYEHEWDHHGTCYLRNIIEDNEKDFEANPSEFNATVLKKYFSGTIDKVKSLNIVLEPGKVYKTKSEFAKDIGFEGKQDHFYVNCRGDQEIDEILICYTRSAEPGKEVPRKCPWTYKDCPPPFAVTDPSKYLEVEDDEL